jgi:hypothetical protein
VERSDPAPVLDPEVVEFVHGGVAVGVATRDDELKPALARGWGPEVENGAVAVGFSPPTIARAVQVKGVATEVGEPDAADLERAERHFRLFFAECERIGAPPHVPERMFVRSGLVLIRFAIDEAFDQTPGPTAGRRL